MIENLPPEAKGGAVTGLLLLGIAILRKIGLKASEDMTTLKADGVERDAMDAMQKRIDKMEEYQDKLEKRVSSLESSRNRLFGFITRCMGYVARCSCEDERASVEKGLLEAEYLELLKDASK